MSSGVEQLSKKQMIHVHINCVSHVMRKPGFGISENEGADQLRANHTADQHLCFC